MGVDFGRGRGFLGEDLQPGAREEGEWGCFGLEVVRGRGDVGVGVASVRDGRVGCGRVVVVTLMVCVLWGRRSEIGVMGCVPPHVGRTYVVKRLDERVEVFVVDPRLACDSEDQGLECSREPGLRTS